MRHSDVVAADYQGRLCFLTCCFITRIAPRTAFDVIGRRRWQPAQEGEDQERNNAPGDLLSTHTCVQGTMILSNSISVTAAIALLLDL